jgi:hypothetical protein
VKPGRLPRDAPFLVGEDPKARQLVGQPARVVCGVAGAYPDQGQQALADDPDGLARHAHRRPRHTLQKRSHTPPPPL